MHDYDVEEARAVDAFDARHFDVCGSGWAGDECRWKAVGELLDGLGNGLNDLRLADDAEVVIGQKREAASSLTRAMLQDDGSCDCDGHGADGDDVFLICDGSGAKIFLFNDAHISRKRLCGKAVRNYENIFAAIGENVSDGFAEIGFRCVRNG